MTEFISVSDTEENMVTFCGTSFMKDMGVRRYIAFQKYSRYVVRSYPCSISLLLPH